MSTGTVRDPDRRERILQAAAQLIAEHGYLGVTLGEIGAAAGIVGSGIYRHFDGKMAILAELLDRVVDRLVADAERLLRSGGPPEATLAALVRGQVQFTLAERALCEVYLQEARNLPAGDLRRLKWKQRHYVEAWTDLLRAAVPGLSAAQAQVRVHGALASVHSCLHYHPAASPQELADSLAAGACRLLGVSAAGVSAAG